MKHKREQQDSMRKEDKLMLLCARTKMNDKIKSQILSLVQQDIDWDYLLKRSSVHRLNPLIYWQLKNICPNSVPKNIMESLRTYFHKNTCNNLFFLGELFKILDLFESQGISAIPYKGPILAIQIYGNLIFREFGDLDIFIKQKDAPKAKKILQTISYQSYLELNEIQEKKFFKSQNDLQFSNQETGLVLELHWKFSSLFFWSPISECKIIELEEPFYINIQEHKIRTFNIEDLFLILCNHNSSHHWSRLSWICDISEFIELYKDTINWANILEKATKMGTKRILLINIYLLNILLGTPIPEYLNPYIESDKKVKTISNYIINMLTMKSDTIRLFERVQINLIMRDNVFFGLMDSLKGAFQPTVYEWKNKPIPVLFYPFYYLYRPFMLIKRHKI